MTDTQAPAESSASPVVAEPDADSMNGPGAGETQPEAQPAPQPNPQPEPQPAPQPEAPVASEAAGGAGDVVASPGM